MIENAMDLVAQTDPESISSVLWTELVLMTLVVVSMASAGAVLFRRMANVVEARITDVTTYTQERVKDLKSRIEALERALTRTESQRDDCMDRLLRNQQMILEMQKRENERA